MALHVFDCSDRCWRSTTNGPVKHRSKRGRAPPDGGPAFNVTAGSGSARSSNGQSKTVGNDRIDSGPATAAGMVQATDKAPKQHLRHQMTAQKSWSPRRSTTSTTKRSRHWPETMGFSTARGRLVPHRSRREKLSGSAQECTRLSGFATGGARERLGRAARFVKHVESEDGVQTVNAHPGFGPSKQFMRGDYPTIRPLEAVTEFPVLRADGSILNAPGYDATTGLLYEPNGPVPRIPATPSLADAMASRDLLLDLVRDFPSEGRHRSTWLAALITALARRAFNGPAPLFLFDANAAGSGKTLLAEVISLVVNGRDIPRMSNPTNNEEARKLITARGDWRRPANPDRQCGREPWIAAVDAALTGTSWKDRILGRSEIASMPLSVTWLASGNNVVLGADTSRRVAHCRLDCRENPEERSGFKYPDLKAHVEAHRSELLAAALTLLRAYFVAGRPTAALKPWGSFENWSALVRQVIVWCELPDPGDTRQELRSTDSEAARFRAVLDGLAEAAPNGTGLTTAGILKMTETVASLKDAVDELCDAGPGKPATTRTLGNRLKRMRGKVCRGRTLKMGQNSTGFAVWSIVSADGRVTDSADSTDCTFPSATQRTRTHARTRTRTRPKQSRQSQQSQQAIASRETRRTSFELGFLPQNNVHADPGIGVRVVRSSHCQASKSVEAPPAIVWPSVCGTCRSRTSGAARRRGGGFEPGDRRLNRERALAKAFEAMLSRLLTEPLSKIELGSLFDVHRTEVGPLLRTLRGVRQVGTRFRVRLVDMPPAYWLKRGLIQPECRNLSEKCRFWKRMPRGLFCQG